jgi:hypothetical protein
MVDRNLRVFQFDDERKRDRHRIERDGNRERERERGLKERKT